MTWLWLCLQLISIITLDSLLVVVIVVWLHAVMNIINKHNVQWAILLLLYQFCLLKTGLRLFRSTHLTVSSPQNQFHLPRKQQTSQWHWVVPTSIQYLTLGMSFAAKIGHRQSETLIIWWAFCHVAVLDKSGYSKTSARKKCLKSWLWWLGHQYTGRFRKNTPKRKWRY